MRTETRLFFEAVMRENRPVADFIDGRYTFLNENLASYYGISGVAGSEFRRVELKDADALRHGGVHAGKRADCVELSDAHFGGAAG